MKEFIFALQNNRDFKGRTIRKDYWLFMLIGHIIYPLIIFYSIQQLPSFGPKELLSLSFPFYYILIATPTLAIQVRRLNDIGYSWKYLFLLIIPPLGIVLLLVISILNSKKRDSTTINSGQELTPTENSNSSSRPQTLYRLLTGLMIGLFLAAATASPAQSFILSIEPPTDEFKGSDTNPIIGLAIGFVYGLAIHLTVLLSFILGYTLGYKYFNKFLVKKQLI